MLKIISTSCLLQVKERTIKKVQLLPPVNQRKNQKRQVQRIRPTGLAVKVVLSHPVAQVALVVRDHLLLLPNHISLHEGQRNLSQSSHHLPPEALKSSSSDSQSSDNDKDNKKTKKKSAASSSLKKKQRSQS